MFSTSTVCRRLQSCPLWNPSWMSLGSPCMLWWRRMLAPRSRTSDPTSRGRSSWMKRFLISTLNLCNHLSSYLLRWFEIEQVSASVLASTLKLFMICRKSIQVSMNHWTIIFLLSEAFLWAAWAADGSSGVPAYWGVDEWPEGLSERLHGKRFWRGLCPRWSLRHWTRTAGKNFGSLKKTSISNHLYRKRLHLLTMMCLLTVKAVKQEHLEL